MGPRWAARDLAIEWLYSPMKPFAFAFASTVLLAAGVAGASPGVYAQQALPSPLAGGVLPTGAQLGIHPINGLGLSVIQRVGGSTNQSASVPLCLSADGTKVGHAYGVKQGSAYVPRCYVDGGAQPGARVLQPNDVQSRNVKWAPLAAGQALPKSIAPVELLGGARAPVYACKAGAVPAERIGTLLADGKCRVAPTLTEQASTVSASSVLLWSATGNAAPRYGWITLAAGFHHPGGDLVKWPTGAVYCVAGGTPGVLELTAAPYVRAAMPAGSVRGCTIRVGGGSSTVDANIRVFRNDTQSGAHWDFSGGTEMSEASGVACVASDGAEGVTLSVQGRPICGTPSGARTNFRTLRRTGAIPGEGDRG
jgi:hypothetical protein